MPWAKPGRARGGRKREVAPWGAGGAEGGGTMRGAEPGGEARPGQARERDGVGQPKRSTAVPMAGRNTSRAWGREASKFGWSLAPEKAMGKKME